jgi:hypothetical protein
MSLRNIKMAVLESLRLTMDGSVPQLNDEDIRMLFGGAIQITVARVEIRDLATVCPGIVAQAKDQKTSQEQNQKRGKPISLAKELMTCILIMQPALH